jgi:hypothetical protein
MANELIFIVMVLVELTFILLLMHVGKEGLFGLIVANIILVSTFGSQLIKVFGLVTNAGNVFYASIFVAANILTENHGRKTGYRSVWIGFTILVLFVLMSQFVLRHVGVPDSADTTNAIATLFRGVPRIALASMAAYLVAQNLNVWLFDQLHQKNPRRGLWFRNMVSSFIGQLVDSLIFFSIAFAGIVPLTVLAQTIFTGFALKAMIAVVSTPVLYASHSLLEPVDVGQN